MNYLIIEILGCLLLAGIIGAILGWFLRGGCQKKLENNALDWQEKLRIDNLASKNKISILEEKFLHQLHDKDDEYKVKLDQIMFNQTSNNSDVLKNEIIVLKEKLELFEKEKIKNEEEWGLVLEDVELGLKNKLSSNKLSSKRLNQENKFLKLELDRSVSELNASEHKNQIQKKSLSTLNKKIELLEDELSLSASQWKSKLEERELRWVDKVALLDEVSSSTNMDLRFFKSQLIRSKTMVRQKEDALINCEKKLQEKKSVTKVKQNTIKQKKSKIEINNLKVLRGVGVLIEKDLNRLGVYTLTQIASWNENDLLRIDKALSLHGKIKKERWVEQAKNIIAVQ